jgi:TusA-related sulfurtransferase
VQVLLQDSEVGRAGTKLGDVYEVLSSDAGSQRDIPLWAQKAGHELLGIEKDGDVVKIRVRKAR